MSISFRDAYTAHGVDNYYTLVSETYKNPHEPGVQKALRQILESIVPPTPPTPYYRLLDLAAGSGEATLTAKHWFAQRRPQHRLLLSAHDPFTAALYTRRTGGLPCGVQSFRDIQTRGLAVSPGRTSAKNDVVVVSFALHLCPPSEVWGLLWTLSCECRWLVVLAPHKRPEVGGEHGWERVGREVCVERVRGRLFRSLNFEDVEEVLEVGDTGAEEEKGAEVAAPKGEEEEEEATGKEKEKAVEPPASSSSPQKETGN